MVHYMTFMVSVYIYLDNWTFVVCLLWFKVISVIYVPFSLSTLCNSNLFNQGINLGYLNNCYNFLHS